MIQVVQSDSGLGELLEARGDPMAACDQPWLSQLARIPKDAAAPLAMSGPHPRAVGSYGADCIRWARREMGLNLRWWQRLAVARQLEHDRKGALVWREIVESGPRRIGKSVRLRTTALWRLDNAERFNETQLAMLVSKDLAVGREIHRPSWQWAKERGWNAREQNGMQEVQTPGDDRWLLRAPKAVYGYDVGYGQVDESWGVDPQAITEGLEPALLERESPQLHLTSTAHVKASSLMRRRLTLALRDADPDVLLLLWGARPDADLSDEAVWRAASPHWSAARRDLVRRKYLAAIAGEEDPELDDPDPIRGWAAQYLNVWPLLMPQGDPPGVIDLADWAALRGNPAAPSSAVLVLDVAPDRRSWSIGVAGDAGSRTLVMTANGRRLSEAIPKVAYLVGKRDVLEVAVTPGQAEALIPDLEAELGREVHRMLHREMGAAAAAFIAGVGHGRYVVPQDQPELDAAVANARTRMSREVEVWDRRDWSISISPVVACSAAAFRWSKRPRRRKAGIVVSRDTPDDRADVFG